MNAPDAFPSPWDGFQLASLVPVTSRSSGGGAIPPACRVRHAHNASVTPFLLSCGSLGQPRRRPAFFQRKGHAWESDGVKGSRCCKEVALQSTERSITNDMENWLLDRTRYPPWGTSIGNPHIWTEHQGGGDNSPKPPLPPQVVVVQKGVSKPPDLPPPP